METNCCGAPFYNPGWPDSDICTSCKEHAVPMEEEDVVSLFPGGEGSHQEGFDDEDTWKESEEYLNYKERRPEK